MALDTRCCAPGSINQPGFTWRFLPAGRAHLSPSLETSTRRLVRRLVFPALAPKTFFQVLRFSALQIPNDQESAKLQVSVF